MHDVQLGNLFGPRAEAEAERRRRYLRAAGWTGSGRSWTHPDVGRATCSFAAALRIQRERDGEREGEG